MVGAMKTRLDIQLEPVSQKRGHPLRRLVPATQTQGQDKRSLSFARIAPEPRKNKLGLVALNTGNYT